MYIDSKCFEIPHPLGARCDKCGLRFCEAQRKGSFDLAFEFVHAKLVGNRPLNKLIMTPQDSVANVALSSDVYDGLHSTLIQRLKFIQVGVILKRGSQRQGFVYRTNSRTLQLSGNIMGSIRGGFLPRRRA